MADGGAFHLFHYEPGTRTFTRLTADPWDDITPSLSPDGRWVAYASRRNGYWDLYLLSLENGDILRLTDTPEYDAAPSWSPDGRWIIHETYLDDNLELIIRPAFDTGQEPIRLTDNPAADHSPAWSPQGREVAFISTRNGAEDVWLADLDVAGAGRFSNLSHNTRSRESGPAWSPDGGMLAWSSLTDDGLSSLLLWDATQPSNPPLRLADGDGLAWLDQSTLLARYPNPNTSLLVGYDVTSRLVTHPTLLLPGLLHGLTVGRPTLPDPLPGTFQQAVLFSPAPLSVPQTVTPDPLLPAGRAVLVDIPDIQAPYPRLHDQVDEAFSALRQRVANDVGWDALASLENAFVPITTPLDPGLGYDWLYTGRAFILNSLLVNAGWMVAAPEPFGQQAFWRVYLWARAQDGSMGEPLHFLPWDFSARYSGDPGAYDQGGLLYAHLPPGYWVDLTALAQAYGWERLPALSNWRTFFSGARIGEFAITSGMDWSTAMLEMYPAEAFITPTVVIQPTLTPTKIPAWYKTPSPTVTPSPRPTLTPRP